MASRDLYKDLSKAWGSKEKKAESRQSKSTLRRLTIQEVQELEDDKPVRR